MDQIMIGVPPSIGWIEWSYSIFEMICSKRRIFLMAVLIFQLEMHFFIEMKSSFYKTNKFWLSLSIGEMEAWGYFWDRNGMVDRFIEFRGVWQKLRFSLKDRGINTFRIPWFPPCLKVLSLISVHDLLFG